ncbi:MAG: DUF5683 domain-containing protein [bacterium]
MRCTNQRLIPLSAVLLFGLSLFLGSGVFTPVHGQSAVRSDSTVSVDSTRSGAEMEPPAAPQPGDSLEPKVNRFQDEYNRSFGTSGPQIDMHQVNMDHGVPLRKSPTKAFIMSLLVPGLGQFYTHNYFKSLAFFGTDAGMIAGILQQDRLSKTNRQLADQTLAQGSPERVYTWHYYLADFYKSDRNKLIWWTAGVTLLAATDAYVEAHLYDFHIDPTLGVTPQGDGITTGLRITFDH